MSKVNYAAIDIGSNAVRLLIKSINPETSEQLFTKELLLRVPLRLGEEVFTQGEIPASKAKKLLRLMKAYRQLMKIYEVDAYRACATSAMRDAANGKEVIETITRKSGIRIDIINGEEEARLVYDNHIEYLADKNADYIYVDVGGGSTEISLIHQGILRSSRSYNIGTVRLLKGKVVPSVYNRLKRDLNKLREQYPVITIIGSGGNINKLFRLAKLPAKNKMTLPVEKLVQLNNTLKKLFLRRTCPVIQSETRPCGCHYQCRRYLPASRRTYPSEAYRRAYHRPGRRYHRQSLPATPQNPGRTNPPSPDDRR